MSEKSVRGRGVRVPCGKEFAIHAGLESCATHREARREMFDRGARRPAIEPRNVFVQGADAFIMAEGKTHASVIASAHRILRGQRPWHVRTTLIRELRDLQVDHDGVVRVG